MTKRKTMNVEAMLEKFNTILASNTPQKYKIGICTAIEIMLMDANRYAGYRYLNTTYNARTERYDIDPDTDYNRQYFVKNVK
jgi:hypothetical protein